MIKKLAFIAYPVADLDRSLAFYSDVLGLKILFKEDGWAEFDIGGQRLALHQEMKPSRPGPPAGAAVYFQARPVEDMVESLKQKGVSFRTPLETHSYGKLICFSDPDGNVLGLYEPPLNVPGLYEPARE